MNTTVLSLFFCAVLGLTAAYYMGDASNFNGYSDDDDDDIETYFPNKRSAAELAGRNLCLPYRAPCTLDSALLKKYPFLKCCNDVSCRCTIWGNNCRCEATLGR
ncbi:U8-agatoxin-Ao1a-like [Physella acuta]|uniref:U8-agatoxin-Ao1a-like n=1 Tax=Physella acuta TaxID=109671 RepID=UPI0027DC8611|nr:U8-agatoxin-Ao1a-like [Physella acuta]XP_059165835.1 U8-agatoxin-Ao1a-like [Physella acuta]XP_059165836.1 U8-agatoxin-Ao1a-like [Physella acuta]XP_059165837.1 U8-agatoxin-Ao1a-like [Physella acuta]XP_059165838.1 U8-agatoxin-Ao1a-like [Physella acuta]XP_059165839.1 U8-agatoxin-Ao1a-like [Physella acuta]